MSLWVHEGEEKLQRCAVLSESDRFSASVDFGGWKGCGVNFKILAMNLEKRVVAGLESDVGICSIN